MIDDGNRLRNEVSKLTKQNIQQMKKYQLLEQAKAGVESDRLLSITWYILNKIFLV